MPRNDAVDALISYLYKYFRTVKADYATLLLDSYFPEFTQLFIRLNEIARRISPSRSSNRPIRNDIYEEIVKNDIPRLRELHEQIETSKDLIDDDTKQERAAQTKKERINWAIGLGGALLSAIGVGLTLYALW